MTQKYPVFVRDATGLVRSFSGFHMMWFNVVSFGAAWSIIYALEYAPLYGGDPITSLLITAPGVLALLLTSFADIMFSWGTLTGWYYSGHPIELLWLYSYLAFGIGFDEKRTDLQQLSEAPTQP